MFKSRRCVKKLVLRFGSFDADTQNRQKEKALIFQGFQKRRTPFFDKIVRKAEFVQMEQDTGVEPASSAWEADVLPMYESCVAWILRGVLGYHSIFFAKKQPFSGEEKKPGLRREARGDSAELGAGGNGVVEHDEVELFFTLFLMHGGEQHAARLLAHHLSGREVDDGGERLADKGFRLVELRDAGEDLPAEYHR